MEPSLPTRTCDLIWKSVRSIDIEETNVQQVLRTDCIIRRRYEIPASRKGKATVKIFRCRRH